jgi:hypothetical protein
VSADDETVELTPTGEEARAIRALKRLAKRWPSSLWLFSASGSLCVMRSGEDGKHVHTAEYGIDPRYSLDTIDISSDGGDW